LLAKPDPVTGEPRKREYGPWMLRSFGLLAKLKGLRGTAFDPFGRGEDRKIERRLIRDYETALDRLETTLTPETAADWLAFLKLPETIRGFGPVKLRTIAAQADARAELERKLGLPRADT
jgi:indolepyruvate ferredoxin oxidoreductase